MLCGNTGSPPLRFSPTDMKRSTGTFLDIADGALSEMRGCDIIRVGKGLICKLLKKKQM